MMKNRAQLTIWPAIIMIMIAALRGAAQERSLVWKPVAPGIWSARVGVPEQIDLLKAARIEPKQAELRRLGAPALPAAMRGSIGRVADHRTFLRFPLDATEQLFGFGLNFKHVQQRKRIFNLHVDHYGNGDSGRTHAPVPFYVSSSGYGILINSARYLTVYAGTGLRRDSARPPKIRDRNTDKGWEANPDSDVVEVLVPAGGVEVYLFAGPTPLEVVQRYNLYSGGGAMPPKWGLGFTQRVPTLYTAADVSREVDEFDRHDFRSNSLGWSLAGRPDPIPVRSTGIGGGSLTRRALRGR